MSTVTITASFSIATFWIACFFQRAKLQSPLVAKEEFCLDNNEALQHNCGCREYTGDVNIDGEAIKAGSEEFEYEIIMAYNSVDTTENECLDDVCLCPLAALQGFWTR